MKKKLLVTMLAGTVLSMTTVTGCGKSAPVTETKETVETETSAEETEAVVKPLDPLETAQDALADGGYSVSFSADDLVKTEDGYELTVEVYEYDRYEMEEIDNLKNGSQIQYCNKTITVNEVEKDPETGYITINGGIEQDGIELMEEDGLYRTVTFDNYPIYYSVGKVTLPLSDEVTLEDQVNSEQQSDLPVVEAKDLPDAIKNSELSFNCNNTVITVRQEQIVQIIQYWVP